MSSSKRRQTGRSSRHSNDRRPSNDPSTAEQAEGEQRSLNFSHHPRHRQYRRGSLVREDNPPSRPPPPPPTQDPRERYPMPERGYSFEDPRPPPDPESRPRTPPPPPPEQQQQQQQPYYSSSPETARSPSLGRRVVRKMASFLRGERLEATEYTERPPTPPGTTEPKPPQQQKRESWSSARRGRKASRSAAAAPVVAESSSSAAGTGTGQRSRAVSQSRRDKTESFIDDAPRGTMDPCARCGEETLGWLTDGLCDKCQKGGWIRRWR